MNINTPKKKVSPYVVCRLECIHSNDAPLPGISNEYQKATMNNQFNHSPEKVQSNDDTPVHPSKFGEQISKDKDGQFINESVNNEPHQNQHMFGPEDVPADDPPLHPSEIAARYGDDKAYIIANRQKNLQRTE